MMKIIILTSNGIRHDYFVSEIAKDFDVIGVVREETSEYPQDNVLRLHFEKRNDKERTMLPQEHIDDMAHLNIERYKLNTQPVIKWIDINKPDLLLSYGCSIIKEELLNKYRIINMHLGLSPYYVGAGTNFFPFVNNEPECVGVTIHKTTKDLDMGEILIQGRPTIEPSDTMHVIGCKTIMLGTQLMKKVLTGQRKYKKKDFNKCVLQKAQDNFADGMIEDYLKNKPERDKAFPIKEDLDV